MTGIATPIVLKFKSADGQIFEVEEDVASVSLLMKGMLEDIRIENDEGKRLKETISMIPVQKKYLKLTLQYCEHHKNIPYVEEEENPMSPQKDPRTDWDKEFLDQIHICDTTFLQAANYLEIPGLCDILAYRIAKHIEYMSVEEIRDFFGVENDFTEEEMKELEEAFSWLDPIEPKRQEKDQKWLL